MQKIDYAKINPTNWSLPKEHMLRITLSCEGLIHFIFAVLESLPLIGTHLARVECDWQNKNLKQIKQQGKTEVSDTKIENNNKNTQNVFDQTLSKHNENLLDNESNKHESKYHGNQSSTSSDLAKTEINKDEENKTILKENSVNNDLDGKLCSTKEDNNKQTQNSDNESCSSDDSKCETDLESNNENRLDADLNEELSSAKESDSDDEKSQISDNGEGWIKELVKDTEEWSEEDLKAHKLYLTDEERIETELKSFFLNKRPNYIAESFDRMIQKLEEKDIDAAIILIEKLSILIEKSSPYYNIKYNFAFTPQDESIARSLFDFLDYTISICKSDLLKPLLQKTTDTISKNLGTVLEIAIIENRLDILKLIDPETLKSMRGSSGQSLLHIAKPYLKDETVDYLIKIDCDCSLITTAEFRITEKCKIVKYLADDKHTVKEEDISIIIEKGLDYKRYGQKIYEYAKLFALTSYVNDQYNCFPRWITKCASNYFDIPNLIEQRIDINRQIFKDNTILHIVMGNLITLSNSCHYYEKYYEEIIVQLLKNGADHTLKNDEGKDAFEILQDVIKLQPGHKEALTAFADKLAKGKEEGFDKLIL